MQETARRAAKILGANTVQSAGSNFAFEVEGDQGGRLKVSVGGDNQRLMAVLKDGAGITRATVDCGPVTHVTEHDEFPHRVTVHVGHLRVHLDGLPTVGIEVETVND